MRVATIDIGTNTVLLLVAERPDGAPPGTPLAPVLERATITRLGQEVDALRRLHPDAVARTRACLEAYADDVTAQRVDRIAVVGTSAMRDAGGGEAITDFVRERFGVEARTISGDEEARLTFRGALSGLPDPPRGPVVVIDVGGGSTEVVRGDVGAPEPTWARSFDLGSVRLTERALPGDPPDATALAVARSLARAAFAPLADDPEPTAGARTVVGVAGTVTTLSALHQALATYDPAKVHGSSLTRADVERAVERLAAATVAERSSWAGVEPKRADVLLGGALVVEAALAALGADTLRVSDRGVRWGLAESLADV